MKILEAKIEYSNRVLQSITLLVDFTISTVPPLSDVRAIVATNKPVGGYTYLMPGEDVSQDLIQRVASYGMETVERDKCFPGWRKKYSK